MGLLHVAFTDGFTGDTVIARINDEVVFHKENVKTRTQISFADSFEVNVEKGSVNVEVHLPLRNLSQPYEVQVSDEVYVEVSVYHGRIEYRLVDRFRSR